MNLHVLRRQFSALHDELRNRGLNPIEAVAQLATLLSSAEDDQLRGGDGLTDTGAAALSSVLAEEAVRAGATAVAFQEFLTSEARNGLGQYLTPLPVAEFVAEVGRQAQPRGLAIDPFCGSGLLLELLGQGSPDLKLLGLEINETVASLAEGLGNISHTQPEIRRGDAFAAWAAGQIPKADVVVTNPPFGTLARLPERDQFAGLDVPESLAKLRAIPAELLGLELSVSVLRPGGFLAIVLPQSVLTNNSWGDYRVDVFQRVSVRAVVSLPEAAFAPFKGVAKACVVFAEKTPAVLPIRFPFHRSSSVGYDDNGRPDGEADLADIGQRLYSETVPVAQLTGEGAVNLPPTIALDPSRCVPLDEIADVFRGANPKRDQFVSDGPWLLKVGNLTGSFIAWQDRARNRVTQDFFESKPRLHLRVGDICLTAAAHKPRYIGLKVDVLDAIPAEGAMPSGELIVIRLHKDSGVRPEHLLFYLRSPSGYAQMQDLVRGSTAHLYPRDLAGMLVPRLTGVPGLVKASATFNDAAELYRAYLRAENETDVTMRRVFEELENANGGA